MFDRGIIDAALMAQSEMPETTPSDDGLFEWCEKLEAVVVRLKMSSSVETRQRAFADLAAALFSAIGSIEGAGIIGPIIPGHVNVAVIIDGHDQVAMFGNAVKTVNPTHAPPPDAVSRLILEAAKRGVTQWYEMFADAARYAVRLH